MIGPIVTARVKKSNGPSCARIDRRNITPLVAVTENAGICQVVALRRAAMLAANDMINLVRKTCVVLVDKAILATIVRAVSYCGTQLIADVTGHA